MRNSVHVILALVACSNPLVAQDAPGDAEAGESYFGRQCVACHAIADDTGNVIAGSRAGMGPNLYGIVGDTPGTREGYDDYSDALAAYGETGVVWEESNIVAFLQNPSGHLREALDDSSARSKMSYRLRDEEEARDVYAYLATFSDPEDEEGDTE